MAEERQRFVDGNPFAEPRPPSLGLPLRPDPSAILGAKSALQNLPNIILTDILHRLDQDTLWKLALACKNTKLGQMAQRRHRDAITQAKARCRARAAGPGMSGAELRQTPEYERWIWANHLSWDVVVRSVLEKDETSFAQLDWLHRNQPCEFMGLEAAINALSTVDDPRATQVALDLIDRLGDLSFALFHTRRHEPRTWAFVAQALQRGHRWSVIQEGRPNDGLGQHLSRLGGRLTVPHLRTITAGGATATPQDVLALCKHVPFDDLGLHPDGASVNPAAAVQLAPDFLVTIGSCVTVFGLALPRFLRDLVFVARREFVDRLKRQCAELPEGFHRRSVAQYLAWVEAIP